MSCYELNYFILAVFWEESSWTHSKKARLGLYLLDGNPAPNLIEFILWVIFFLSDHVWRGWKCISVCCRHIYSWTFHCLNTTQLGKGVWQHEKSSDLNFWQCVRKRAQIFATFMLRMEEAVFPYITLIHLLIRAHLELNYT